MVTDLVLFFLLAIVAVASAVGMLLSKSAIYSALNLIINFGTVAVFYLLLGAPFISLAQVTVYAGAIMVLFLFVIMLLGAEQLSHQATLPWQRPLAIGLAVLLLAEGAYVLFFRSGALPAAQALANADFGNPAAVGEALFNQYLLPFEVTSILLLVAMVGAIVLTRRQPKPGRN
jgi:NADH-quinone oxidoreductase subunit J